MLAYLSNPNVLKFIIIVIIGVLLYLLLRRLNIFTFNKAGQASENDYKERLKEEKRNARKRDRLKFIEALGNFLFIKNEYGKRNYWFLVERLNLKYGVYEITGAHFKGLYVLSCALVVFLGVIASIIRFRTIGNIVTALGIVAFFTDKLVLDYIVSKQDAMIKKYFSELYMVIYSEIYYTSNCRIIRSLASYAKILEKRVLVDDQLKPLYNFVEKYLQYISREHDEIRATEKMAEVYKFPLWINVSTLIAQRLEGKDNQSKLDSLKEEILRERSKNIKEKGAKIQRKGERLNYIVYIVLVEIVVLSFAGNFLK